MIYNAQVSVLSENVYFAMGPMDIVAYKACFFIQTQAIKNVRKYVTNCIYQAATKLLVAISLIL